MIKVYLNRIERGFASLNDLLEFIGVMEEDIKLSARAFQDLRYIALKRYYETGV